MIERKDLENLVAKRVEIGKMQADWNDEFGKHKNWLLDKAIGVLLWKDENLGTQCISYTFLGKYYPKRCYIKAVRSNCVVICVPYSEPELSSKYYNVTFDEIYSDDWKEDALKKKYEKDKQTELEMKKEAEERKRVAEEWERKEYERLKAKFEN